MCTTKRKNSSSSPTRDKAWKTKPMPGLKEASLYDKLTFGWVTPLLVRGFRETLTLDSIFELHDEMKSENVRKKFEVFWNIEKTRASVKRRSPSLVRAFFHAFWRQILYAEVMLFFFIILQFTGPLFFLRNLILYVSKTGEPLWEGIALTCGLFCNEFIRSIIVAQHWFTVVKLATQARSITYIMVYDKAMNLRSLGSLSVGQIVNMSSNDGQRYWEAIGFGSFIFGAGLSTILTITLSWWILGWTSLFGSFVFLLFYAVQGVIAKFIARIRRRAIKITDSRVRLMNEVLTSIKLIKFYSWENSFHRKVSEIRGKEKINLEKAAYLQSSNVSMTPIAPVISAVAAFSIHVILGKPLSASDAFTIIAIFNALRLSVAILPLSVKAISESSVGLERLHVLLAAEERKPIACVQDDPEVALCFEKATFNWNSSEMKVVTDVNNENRDIYEQTEKEKTGEATELASMRSNPAGDTENVQTEAQVEFSEVDHCEQIDSQISFKESTDLDRFGDSEYYCGEQVDAMETEVVSHSKMEDILELSPEIQSSEGPDAMKCIEEIVVERKDEMTAEVALVSHSTLKNIDLSIRRGSLVGLCGSVGSGKSSIFHSVLGTIKCESGTVYVNGSVAYVAQQPWIFNASLRENIVSIDEAIPFNATRYQETLRVCCLLPDLGVLPHGDETSIGERGINLSGGQKALISLARAVYANRDIYLLDDTLSAVDAHVGELIFEGCIRSYLLSKTVIFVTHQLQYLSRCDKVVTLSNGTVAEQGSYRDLIASAGPLSILMKEHYGISQTDINTDESRNIDQVELSHSDQQEQVIVYSRQDSSPSKLDKRLSIQEIINAEKAPNLIEKEERVEGAVEWDTYKAYMRAGGGIPLYSLLFFAIVIAVASKSFNDWWLSYWLNQGDGLPGNATTGGIEKHDPDIRKNANLNFYIMIFVISAIVVVILQILKGLFFMKMSLRSSSQMHNDVYARVLSAPMSYFDTTPTGRILNRFSKDLDEVDVKLPEFSEQFFNNVITVLITLGVISTIFPWFLVALVPLIVFFCFLNMYFRRSARELKRLDNVTRSPIFAHMTASIQGLTTIHAFDVYSSFLTSYRLLVDDNARAFFAFYVSNRWLGFRLELITSLVATITALVAVLTREQVPATLIGLALSYSMYLNGLFQWTVRLTAEVESRFTSVERIHYYIENTPCEGKADSEVVLPPESWPAHGKIEFINVQVRYRDGLPLVLQGLNCVMESGEKVGVVGRTGAGKSTLSLVLWRLVEVCEGRIMIDDIDIASLPLSRLRSSLSIIPQDPSLFSGDIRSNIDPFSEYSDPEVWNALEAAHVKYMVEALPLGLASVVDEGGRNFSVGERQLLCIARALLRNTRIILLDEASSSIDVDTDALIQATIRQRLSSTTMIIIAHRLNTLSDCSKVLVLDNGIAVEYDSPDVLMSNPLSHLAMMVSAAGGGDQVIFGGNG